MKIKIKDRTVDDFFHYLSMVEESQERATEWAVENFVDMDEEPATLEKYLTLTGEQQAILSGRVFSLNVKGFQQDDEKLIYKNEVYIRKAIAHNVLEKLQLKIQKMKEKGDTATSSMIKASIPLFYDVKIDDLKTQPYQVAAVMFNTISSFLNKVADSQDEFDFDD